jgi:DNA-binding MarR family transcriptional regulator
VASVPPHVAGAFEALGPPIRLKIMLLLQEEELGAAELVRLLGAKYDTVNHALKRLVAAGLVLHVRTESLPDTIVKRKIYRARHEGWPQLVEVMDHLSSPEG